MIVGVRVLRFSIPENTSLKGKRSIVRSAIERTVARFNAAIAEVGAQDEHRRAIVGVTVLSNSGAHASRMLDEIDAFLCQAEGWTLHTSRTELLPLGILPNTTMTDDLRWTDFEDDDA